MKKKIILIVSIFVLLTLPMMTAYAGDEPSSWAEEEVDQAILNGLVPVELQKNYQGSIKRYEYVLLALEVLEKNGDNIKVVHERPFTDIDNHQYRNEIIKAYNAGIINGYGDGTFKPDADITRQEVASLVVNLIIRIDPYRDVRNSGELICSDKGDISSWALTYINYCYNNQILKGIGKDSDGLDIINPVGKATIEQSVLLLYRLVQTENILNIYDLGTVELIQYIDDNRIATETEMINQFAVSCGEGLAKLVQTLSLNEGIEITDIGDYYVTLDIKDSGMINIFKSDSAININGNLNNISNQLFKDTYGQVVSVLDTTEEVKVLFNTTINKFKVEKDYKVSEVIRGNNYFEAFSEDIDGELRYAFQYSDDIFND